ncbi:MAG: CotH kinase family protein [Ruminococcus sp.]|uniref:CotH kinase family protein n=1 Tax=Ruminococcus sp. TaxID=41978 RepID=UPI0025CE4C59|nr:CotH kinase family protein [Ruminococcus sp.]MCR5600368.1 CotH kinase family protein [Ruminococcus sp.]
MITDRSKNKVGKILTNILTCGSTERSRAAETFRHGSKKALTAAIISALAFTNHVPFFATGAENERTVTINEICTKNTSVASPDGIFYDFVELYNPNDKAVSLSGYSLSDDKGAPKKYVFPHDAVIEAGGFYVVYCGVKEGSQAEGTTFGLSKNGETLLLSDPNGKQLECIEVPPLADNISYGRIPDGSGSFGELREMTLGSVNSENAFVLSVPKPTFSQGSGFYDSEFKLSLSAPEGYSIYYTLDGSDPTVDSERYETPISVYDRSEEENVFAAITDIDYGAYTAPEKPVDKAMIVRAIAADADGNISPIVSNTYFIGYTEKDYAKNMRVISLVTDPDNLFDDEKGIYVAGKAYNEANENGIYTVEPNYTMEGKEWERPANITVFENSKASYTADIGIRIRGAVSRFEAQKSFTLNARSEYGPRKMNYDFFNGELRNINGKVIDSFDSIALRNGGNDVKTKLRDRLNQELSEDRDFGILKQTECVLFIDGEFWGLYNITEKIDEDYIADHYKVKSKNVQCFKVGNTDYDEITEVYKTINNIIKNTDSDELYDKLDEFMDMKSFMDYMAVEIIIGNSDSGNNNTAFWKTTKIDSNNPYADGRFRFILYDTEAGQGLYKDKAEEPNLFKAKELSEDSNYVLLFDMLKKSEKVRMEFMRTYFDLCNENYKADNVLRRVNELASLYKLPMLDTFERFSYESYVNGGKQELTTAEKYENEVGKLTNFWKKRDKYAKSHLIEFLGDKVSGETYQLDLDNNAEQGSIQLNTLTLDCAESKWQGDYPKELPIILKAVPKNGYKFLRWEISGAEYTSGSETSTEAVLMPDESSVSIKAVYSPDKTTEELIWGDANCDGEVDLSDAVLIMQSIANPDKYGLRGTEPSAITEKGSLQADVDISTKGVTGNDALKIQKYLLRLISSLDPNE